MKNWIAMFAVCSAASGAFAEVVSLIPGQQVVVPASVPGSVPVTIEAGVLKQTSQLSWLPAYGCQDYTTSQIASDPNWSIDCDSGGMIVTLSFLQRQSNGTLIANKPSSLRNTYVTYSYDPGYQYSYRSDINGGWSGIQIDLSTGAPTDVTASTGYSLTVSKVDSFSTGGTYREGNLHLVAADKKVYSNVDGISTPTKSSPSVVYKQINYPVWTFDSWVGPALPLSRLASTQNIIARTQYLTGAGFKVTNLGGGTLYAVGTYKTLNMRMTTEGQKLMSSSLGLLYPFTSALRYSNNGVDNNYNPVSFSATIGYFIN